jgi:hypothetical protein
VASILCSAFNGDSSDLDLGDEVEYVLSRKTAKVSAESIRKLPKGSVAPEVSEDAVLLLPSTMFHPLGAAAWFPGWQSLALHAHLKPWTRRVPRHCPGGH